MFIFFSICVFVLQGQAAEGGSALYQSIIFRQDAEADVEKKEKKRRSCKEKVSENITQNE